jgi:hypothetical protein
VFCQSKTKRCYFYTGAEKDGYFYPLHVAAEAGNKALVLLMVKNGAEVEMQDYRGDLAESKANEEALHAFYELRGLKFEACDRYQGQLDRSGNKNGQGTLFRKPEGYTALERIVYKGGFKQDLYNGRGSLYWPLSDQIQYVGRFKAGLKHGRGVEFDEHGKRVYQGTFRDGKREGRGDEFAEGVRTYKGELLNNVRHGFGISYMDGYRYVGRFENGLMSGVGVLSLPNGERYEGMFFGGRLNGHGSHYKTVVTSTKVSADGNSKASGTIMVATHANYIQGKPEKELTHRFVPKPVDMPDTRDLSQNLLHILDGSVTADVATEASGHGASGEAAVGSPGEGHGDGGQINFSTASRRTGSAYHDQVLAMVHAGMTVSDEAFVDIVANVLCYFCSRR